MAKILNITEARGKLTLLPDELARTHETVSVTRHGKPVLAIMDWELYEAIVETLDILGDQELMTELRHGLKEVQSGQYHDWKETKEELGL
jgi:antitoxin YefM